MKWRSYGGSGLKVTELCLGNMTLVGQTDPKTSYAILDAACNCRTVSRTASTASGTTCRGALRVWIRPASLTNTPW
jgi:hypothetical protein